REKRVGGGDDARGRAGRRRRRPRRGGALHRDRSDRNRDENRNQRPSMMQGHGHSLARFAQRCGATSASFRGSTSPSDQHATPAPFFQRSSTYASHLEVHSRRVRRLASRVENYRTSTDGSDSPLQTPTSP